MGWCQELRWCSYTNSVTSKNWSAIWRIGKINQRKNGSLFCLNEMENIRRKSKINRSLMSLVAQLLFAPNRTCKSVQSLKQIQTVHTLIRKRAVQIGIKSQIISYIVMRPSYNEATDRPDMKKLTHISTLFSIVTRPALDWVHYYRWWKSEYRAFENDFTSVSDDSEVTFFLFCFSTGVTHRHLHCI